MKDTFAGAGAEFDEARLYRYSLWRKWTPAAAWRRVLWIMLNPSTADEAILDPTIRRCVGFSRAWGFDGLEVCNAFAWRSTDPDVLPFLTDPIGLHNDEAILAAAARSSLIVAGWGTHGKIKDRGLAVLDLLSHAGYSVHCLGTNQDGSPKHPLYLAGALTPEILVDAEAAF